MELKRRGEFLGGLAQICPNSVEFFSTEKSVTDRLSGISAFVLAAEAGSFAQAAERLGLTRSAVGKTIARLEERVGTRLFTRTTRGQSLTEEGEAFYTHCVRILAEVEAAEASLDKGRRTPVGRLRVTVPVMLGRLCIAPSLIEFARQQPKVEIEIDFTDRLLDLTEDRIDLAIRIGPMPDRAGLTTRTLGSFKMIVCGSPAYFAARGNPLLPDDLIFHDCLPYAHRGGRLEPWRLIGPDGEVLKFNPTSRIRLNDLDAIVDAAVAGGGIICQPSWLVARHIEAGSLVPALNTYEALGNDVYAVWPQTRHLPFKVRAVIEELSAQVPFRLSNPDTTFD